MKAGNIHIVMKKDLGGLLSERTILLAILLQLFVAMFSSFLMVGLTSMYDPGALGRIRGVEYPIAYTGADSALLRHLNESGDFVVYRMDLSPAVTALGERKLAAVVYVPETPPGAEEPVKITLYTIQNDIQAAVVNVKLKEVFQTYEKELREIRFERLDNPPAQLGFPEGGQGSNFYEFIYGLLIPLLLFMPAIISAALVIDLITEEYQHHTLETLLSTPMTMPEVIWGKVIACWILVPIQAAAWLVLLVINRITIQSIPEILLHVVLFSLILILIGAITALYYRERTSAQFIYSTAVVVLMLFVLALPGNPLNLIALLSTGSAGSGHWITLALTLCIVIFLAILTHLVARYAERQSAS